MIRALWIYLKARFRMIGRCPPHHYEKDGQAFPFCVDCGEYQDEEQATLSLIEAGRPLAGDGVTDRAKEFLKQGE